jgi:DNA-3-methyladenine glycosylase I
MEELKRCAWARGEEMTRYHDAEWGVPVHEDGKLFEMLLLEGFQAGLSWATVLHKRENFRRALDGFDARKIAQYGQEKLDALMTDPAIIRSGRKLRAAVENARAFLAIQREYGSFDRYLWGFTGGRVVRQDLTPMPASTALSERISGDLKRRGMKFVGPVIVYSLLQSVGVVDDHEPDCFRRQPNVLLLGPDGAQTSAVGAALARLTHRRLLCLDLQALNRVNIILEDTRGAVIAFDPSASQDPGLLERVRREKHVFFLQEETAEEIAARL